MKILVYRYGSICEPDIVGAFQKAGLQVIEETTEMTQKKLSDATRVQLVEQVLQKDQPLFVFSINFYPAIADICQIYRVPYLCWTVDSPVPELFSHSICHNTNHAFLFDYAQYQQFSPYNEQGVHYLPLAASTERFQNVIRDITEDERKRFSCDISFVGSLYREKNPYRELTQLPDYTKGFVNALVEASLKIYGSNVIEASLTEEVVADIKKAAPDFYTPNKPVTNTDAYIAAHRYIGVQVTELERIRTLNMLAQFFQVDLFTRSDTSMLQGVHVHGGVQTLTEMPKIFHLSKINLNMTTKPIQTGLPLRIFDILGCGGFLMTNYQAELPEYFDIGVDLEAYSSMEELVDKCDYYLKHEDERIRIAQNGYRKVCESHTYSHRIAQMLKQLSNGM